MWNIMRQNYMLAFSSLHATESSAYKMILKFANDFMLAHRYESAGLWQMFSDFNNHMTYILEHNPIDPAVSLAIESIDIPDLIAPEKMPGLGN